MFGLRRILTLKRPSQKLASNLECAGLKSTCLRNFPLVPFKLADFGEGIREVTVKAVAVKVGDYVNQFDEVCHVESDKASVSVTSRYDGVVRKIYLNVGDVVSIGSTIIDVEIADDDQHTSNDSDPEKEESPLEGGSSDQSDETDGNNGHFDKALTTPAVRRIAMENNINVHDVKGTGKGGRVTKEDVLLYLGRKESQAAGTKTEPSSSPYRKVMVRTMTESNRIPTTALSDEFDLTRLDEIKTRLRCSCDVAKVTLLPFFVKAVSLSLTKYPIMNATFREATEEVVFNDRHNIGIAIDTPMGLAAPNLKNVQQLTIRGIANEIRGLQERALNGTLRLSDTSDGTFAISNIGSIAGTVAKPMILPPQVAIGAVGRIQLLPRFDLNGNLVKSKIAVFSWSADHRVIDGATLGRFSNSVKSYLENPELFLIDI